MKEINLLRLLLFFDNNQATKLDYAILPDSVMGNTGKEAFGQCKMSNVTYKNNAIQ